LASGALRRVHEQKDEQKHQRKKPVALGSRREDWSALTLLLVGGVGDVVARQFIAGRG